MHNNYYLKDYSIQGSGSQSNNWKKEEEKIKEGLLLSPSSIFSSSSFMPSCYISISN